MEQAELSSLFIVIFPIEHHYFKVFDLSLQVSFWKYKSMYIWIPFLTKKIIYVYLYVQHILHVASHPFRFFS